MSQRDGGPAFPPAAGNPFGLVMAGEHYGMSLRDYFAAQALTFMAVIAFKTRDDDREIGPAENVARTAYELADAMLAARAK